MDMILYLKIKVFERAKDRQTETEIEREKE